MPAEYVTLAMVRELMETKGRAFKQTIELYTNSTRQGRGKIYKES